MQIARLLKSKLFKDTASYSVINILDKAIPFLIMPIISRVLTKEDMGCYSLYQVTFQIFIPILTFCLEYPVKINYFKIDKLNYPKFFSTGFFLTLLIWGGIVLICLPFFSQLSFLFGLSEKWLFITCIIVLLNYVNLLRMTLYQQQRMPHKFGLFSVPLMLTKNMLALCFILGMHTGWEGLILGHLIGQTFFSWISLCTFIKEKLLIFQFEKKSIYKVLKVGGPVSIHKLSAWFSHSLNRIIINSILGTAATGNYGIGATFGTIVTVLEDAINKAYAPYLFEQLSKYDETVRRKLRVLIRGYYLGFVSLGIVMSLVGYYGVGFIFGEKYMDTQQFIIPIIVSAVINGLYKLHVNFITYTEKTYIMARNTIVCALANLPIAYIFTKYMGVVGAAYSTIIIQSLLFVLTIHYSNKFYPLKAWLER